MLVTVITYCMVHVHHTCNCYTWSVLPLGLSLKFENKRFKLQTGTSYLTNALQLSDYDTTLHHDMALLLSHNCKSLLVTCM